MRAAPVLLSLLVLLAGCTGDASEDADERPSLPSQPDPDHLLITLGTPANASVEDREPVDPEGPWRTGDERARLAAGDEEVIVHGPLAAYVQDGVIDKVALQDPGGRELASIACEQGACTVRWPVGEHEVPAASLALLGDWQRGRPTGAVLSGADGQARAELRVFSATGARLSGPALDEPVSLTPGLVLEGDPLDVDRLALRAPTGQTVLDVRPGAGGVGRVELLDRSVAFDQVGARVMGDPLTDETVTLVLRLDDRRVRYVLETTPAGSFGAVQDAGDGHVRLRSPLRVPASELSLHAGPVHLEGNGSVSPRYDLLARLVVANASGIERAQLLVDGDVRAELTSTGVHGDERVLHARLDQGLLPDDHGTRIELGLELERDLAPGLVQQHEGPVRTLTLDARGPAPPVLERSDDDIVLKPTTGAARHEAQVRPVNGTYQPVPIEEGHLRLPEAPAGAWEARARGIDQAGNPGPFSKPLRFEVAQAGLPPADPPALAIRWPVEDATLNGTVPVSWMDEPDLAQVHLAVRSTGDGTWLHVGTTDAGPILWDTRSVPDGRYTLRVTGEGPGGTVTRLVGPVEVDNLDPVGPSATPGPFGPPAGEQAPATGPRGPSTAPPLPTAAAWLVGVLVLVGASVGAVRRTGRGK